MQIALETVEIHRGFSKTLIPCMQKLDLPCNSLNKGPVQGFSSSSSLGTAIPKLPLKEVLLVHSVSFECLLLHAEFLVQRVQTHCILPCTGQEQGGGLALASLLMCCCTCESAGTAVIASEEYEND